MTLLNIYKCIKDLDKHYFRRKIVIFFLSISFNMCFGCSKEPSHCDGSFEYPQHTFFFLCASLTKVDSTHDWSKHYISRHGYKNDFYIE